LLSERRISTVVPLHWQLSNKLRRESVDKRSLHDPVIRLTFVCHRIPEAASQLLLNLEAASSEIFTCSTFGRRVRRARR